jgi:TPR repeat protein
MQLHIPQEELPLSDPVPPRVDFSDDGTDVYPNALESLRVPEVEPDPEIRQFLHEAAIRGSVDAVCGIGKQYLNTDVQKAISMFELAAEQGNSYAEYQLGKIYCFGQGVPQNLEVGMEWLKASASHGNEYASALLGTVQNHIHRQTTSAVFGLFRGLASMIQSSANNFIRRRNSIDRKQRQKIEEKKQALGQRSSGQEYDYNEEQTM